jgi:hypothetical protein
VENESDDLSHSIYKVSGCKNTPGRIDKVAFTLSVSESVSGKGGPQVFWDCPLKVRTRNIRNMYRLFIGSFYQSYLLFEKKDEKDITY